MGFDGHFRDISRFSTATARLWGCPHTSKKLIFSLGSVMRRRDSNSHFYRIGFFGNQSHGDCQSAYASFLLPPSRLFCGIA